jgi:dipeptidyl aminopeptidase/acylaminoacyl peptidase
MPGTRGPLSPALIAGLASPSNAVLSPRGDQIAYALDERDAQRLYRLPITGGWPRLITPELRRFGRPAWAPDGRRLVAVADNALWRLRDDGTECVRLYGHPAGLSAPAWSPDGATIAFRCRARGWDQLWTIPFEGGEARRLTEAPADNDAPLWSPGARYLVYSSVRDRLLERHLYRADATTGREECLTAGSGCINLAPAWSPVGARLAFLSERDGYLHLYVRERDGSIRQLTAGPWEEGHLGATSPGTLCWSPDGSEIAFLRNRDGCFDVMVCDAMGEAVRRISPGDGNWGILGWLPDGRRLAATYDSPTQPPDIWLLNAEGGPATQLTFSGAGFRPADLVTPERVRFQSRDGLTIAGWLYRPHTVEPGGCPALIALHGGPHAQSRFSWQPLFQLLVQEGYAVFAPDYRGSTGYGRDFRQANMGAWGSVDLGDILDAARWLRGQSWIDPQRIGVYGASYGGYLVLCALAHAPECFRCGIDLYGDSDLAESYRLGDRVGRLDMERQMGRPEENAAAYARGSPARFAEQFAAPVLILHGREDKRVVPQMSELMRDALLREGKYVECHFYEGEGHGFRSPAARIDSMERILGFLERFLRREGKTA